MSISELKCSRALHDCSDQSFPSRESVNRDRQVPVLLWRLPCSVVWPLPAPSIDMVNVYRGHRQTSYCLPLARESVIRKQPFCVQQGPCSGIQAAALLTSLCLCVVFADGSELTRHAAEHHASLSHGPEWWVQLYTLSLAYNRVRCELWWDQFCICDQSVLQMLGDTAKQAIGVRAEVYY